MTLSVFDTVGGHEFLYRTMPALKNGINELNNKINALNAENKDLKKL